MDFQSTGVADRVGRTVGRHLTKVISYAIRHRKHVLVFYTLVIVFGTLLTYTELSKRPPTIIAAAGADPLQENQSTQRIAPRWGGFEERPMTHKCYRQERIAMLLSVFLGTFGADQWYAHHWPLAVFKFLTLGGAGIWSFVDVILWIMGGVYGTPGCPGGSSNGWAY
ncbi:Fc.00g053210.m01.CDS01 [Cosmosporella sp. VM-42]